jgi:TATA-box binding protein (TBP) (component of TFIID and TFIIIB)
MSYEPIAKRLRSSTKRSDMNNVMRGVQLVNVVAKVTCNQPVSTELLLKHVPGAEPQGRQWGGVRLRLTDPKSTVVVFGNGTVMITGSRSDEDSLATAERVVRIMRAAHHPFIKMRTYEIVNRAFKFEWDGALDMDDFIREVQSVGVRYVPSLFPGGHATLKRSGAAVTLFRRKAMVMGGNGNMDLLMKDLYDLYESMRPHLVPIGSDAEKALNERFRHQVRDFNAYVLPVIDLS